MKKSRRRVPRTVLLTGATGYVGGRLLPLLAADGLTVRCVARSVERLARILPKGSEAVRGDLLDRESLTSAMAGVGTAYYLVHSMGGSGDFEERDRTAARNFGETARAAGVRRIIYLGGLGATDERLSPHLHSRHEVGEILRRSGVPVTEFRASIIIGAGSLSFEMIRALVERLPAMVTPRWVRVPAQPIFVDDVLEYLRRGAAEPGASGVIYEVGGPDVVSYAGIMREYARQRRLRRIMIPVPVLTPRLSSLWLGLVTPMYARVGRTLIDSIRHPTVVTDTSALRRFPVRPVALREAIERALAAEDGEANDVSWADRWSREDGSRPVSAPNPGSRLLDSREVLADASPEQAFAAVEKIGGTTGWYFADWLWTMRGWLDRMVGGVGMGRGRRDTDRLERGDVVDCWTVQVIDRPRRLYLRADMKLPGRAWLEFSVRPDGRRARIRQTAVFDPKGLGGLAYWFAVWPFHQFVFAGMLRGLAEAAPKVNDPGSKSNVRRKGKSHRA